MQKSASAMARWARGETLDDSLLGELAQDFDQLLEAELAAVRRQADEGQGDAALGRLTKLNAFASAAAVQRPSLVEIISGKANRFREALEAVGRALGAVEFSISFGLPAGVSVSLTFVVKPQDSGKNSAGD